MTHTYHQFSNRELIHIFRNPNFSDSHLISLLKRKTISTKEKIVIKAELNRRLIKHEKRSDVLTKYLYEQ